ncbi:MAG TPA: TetR/AcrR family transcriptional regulator [Solirubrobacterales bacterium]|nr:TetR/AcrR family transcriptional regulator [Solirubrobacterales bacterium]
MAELPPALVRESVERKQVSREVRREERRELVLRRLTDVFAKRGYQSATIDQLIAGAKISMGGFYKMFEGKEDCFVQVYDRVMAEADVRLRAAVPETSDWATAIALGMRALVHLAAEQPMGARVVLVEAQTGGDLALARYQSTLAKASDFMRQGRRSSEQKLQDSFEEATVSGLVWLLQSRLARGRIEDADELWPTLVKMVLEPYVGSQRAEQALRSIG